jgi:hypothetical protein
MSDFVSVDLSVQQLKRIKINVGSYSALKNEMFCAPSDRKRLTVMFQKLDSNGSVTCHNRSTIFLMQLIRSLETSDFLLFSNAIDHLVQVFGFYCAECS